MIALLHVIDELETVPYPLVIKPRERWSNVHHSVRKMRCGAKLGQGVTVGQGTVIEVADRAVFCGCGAGVEEVKGEMIVLLTGERVKM